MQKIEVLSFQVKSGQSKKTGLAFSLPIAQCVLHDDDGSKQVGELMLPKGVSEVKPGFYTTTLGLRRNFEGKIDGSIVGLIPVKG